METTSAPDSQGTRAGPAPAPSPLLRFGSFEVDGVSGEIRKHGIRLHLPSQPFQILIALLERPGELVTREDLQQLLWPQGLPADSDRSLNTAVNRLRGTLGDTAGSARYVETLPRKGYRFVAPVERIARHTEQAPPGETLPEPAARSNKPRLRVWGGRALAGIAALGLIVTVVWQIRRGASVPYPSRVLALTDFQGTETTPSLSPDGSLVAFSWNGGTESNLDIYVRTVNSSALSRVTKTIGNAFSPSFSPDGRRIAFYRRAGDSSYVHIVPSDSRELVRAAGLGLNVGPEIPFPARELSAPSPDLAALSWSPGGGELAYVDKSSPAEPFSIFVSPVSDWRGEKITWPPSGIRGDGAPAFSPDGSRIAFVRSVDESSADLYLASLSDGRSRRITHDASRIAGIAWSADAKSIIFSSERSGAPALWRVNTETSALERVRQVREAAVLPTISRTGDALAYVRWAGKEDIVRIPLHLATGSAAPPGGANGFAPDASNPEYSPDGARVAFSAGTGDHREIWLSGPGGESATKLTSTGGFAASPRWSPDGRSITFDARVMNNFGIYDIFVVPAEGGPPRALTSGPVQNTRPAWSGDGRFIYFASDRSGTQQIWKIPAAGGAARQVTQNGGSEAEESPDGKSLYFSRRSVAGLWSIPVAGGAESLVIKDLQWENSRNWTVARDGIYYLLREGTRPANWMVWLKRYDFESGNSQTVARLGNLPIVNGRCSISPSRQSLLCVQERRSETDLAALAGFR